MDEGKEVKRSRDLTRWGIVLSVVYLVIMATYSVVEWQDLLKLDGNEFGDLLAGVFSPLAFLWLVLGFFQQGQELRASVQALELQGRELQHSVEQQRQLVEVTREQLNFQSQALTHEQFELDRASQPRLELTCGGNSGVSDSGARRYAFRLDNFGRPATNVRVVEGDGKLTYRATLLDTGGNLNFKIELPMRGEARKFLLVSYVDVRGLERSQSFHVSINDGIVAVRPESDES